MVTEAKILALQNACTSRFEATVSGRGLEDFPLDFDGHARVWSLVGPRCVAYLLEQFRSMSLVRHWHAGMALACMNSARDVITAGVVPLLEHAHGVVRRHARWVLAALAPESTIEMLRLAAADPARLPVIHAALTYHGRNAAPALPVLDAWPTDPDEPVPYLGEHVRYDGERSQRNTPGNRADART